MGIEIERKFLVNHDRWRPQSTGVRFRQGYVSARVERTVRVRVEGERAVLTVKGPREGLRRLEFEYEIPVADADEMLDQLCERPLIDKHRHVEVHHGQTWEIDVFHAENDGLIVAEIELAAEDAAVMLPDWIDREVSDDPRYFNSNLVRAPYSTWPREDR